MRIPAARWVCLLALVSLAMPVGAADWPMFGGDSAHSAAAPSEVAFPLGLKWEFSTGMKNKDAVSSPVMDADRVYFCLDSKTYALDRRTGERLWEFDSGSLFHSSPAIYDGALYVGAEDGYLYVLDTRTGDVQWKFPTGGPIQSSPNIHDGVCYVGSDDTNIYAISVADRGLRWQYATAGAVKTAPLIWKGMCYVASTDRYLYAIDSSGNLRWRVALGGNPCFSSPTVERDKVIIGVGTDLIAVDAKTGQRRWTFTTGGLVTGSAAIADRYAYIGSTDTSVYAVSAATGRARWRVGLGVEMRSSPVISGPNVIVRCAEGLLVALSRETGQTMWSYRMSKGFKIKKKPEPEATTYGEGAMAPGGAGMGQFQGVGRQAPRRVANQGGALGGGYGNYGGRRGAGAGGAFGTGAAGAGAGTGGYGAYRQQKVYQFEDEVLSSIAVSTDAVFALGDDGSLYALTSDTPDGVGPVVKEAQLDVEGTGQTIVSYPLHVAREEEMAGKYAEYVKIPGTPPISISVAARDTGSGVDPDATEAFLDGRSQDFVYDPETGVVWVEYRPVGQAGVALENGEHSVTFKVADWQGRVTEAHVDFLVDRNLPPPTVYMQQYGTPGAGGAVPGAGGAAMPLGAGGMM